MKKILTISFLLILAFAMHGQQKSGLLVEMPVPPSSIEGLTQRSNFIVDKFWDTFNPKSSFSNLEGLKYTLSQFFSVAPYASADTVHASIDKLLAKVAKAKPDNLLPLARLAEELVASDSADYISEELYFPFVQAVATNKKVKGAEKSRYIMQFRQLDNSMTGRTAADFSFTRPDGSTGNFSDIKTQHILLFFYDPDCTDCRIAKARMAADIAVPTFINAGLLTVMAIYPGEPDDVWCKDAAGLPESWVVGAWPEADTYFTMRNQPEIYYIDNTHRIRVKGVAVDNILNTFNDILNNALNNAK